MAKVLKADASAASASVTATFTPQSGHIWITFRLGLMQAAIDLWTAASSGNNSRFLDLDVDGTSNPESVFLGDEISWSGFWNGQSVGAFGSIPAPVEGWQVVELHYNGATQVSELIVDGSTVWSLSGGAVSAASGYDKIELGLPAAAINDPDAVAYFDYVKVGTTQGADDLFSDDFESGTLVAWDSTDGDVSVIEDPFAVDTEVNGIWIAPNDTTFAENPTKIRLDDLDQPWRVTGFDITRGKATEFDRNEPGRATIHLIDRDGSFDPTNPSAPFPLTLAAQAAITVQNPVTGEWRHLFTGFTKDYPGDFYTTGQRAEVELELGDGFDYLNGVLMAPDDPVRFGDDPPAGIGRTLYYAETDGTGQVRARLNQALDNAGWPSSWRHTFSGNINLQAKVYPIGTPIMSVLEEAVEAEFPAVGVHFMGRRWPPTYIFRGRYPRFDPDSYLSDDGDDIRAGPAGNGGRLVHWKVGGRPQAEADLGTEAEGYRDGTAVISDVAYRHSWEDVINAAVATPEGVDEADVPANLYTDATSISQYGWRYGPDMSNLLVLHGNTPPGQTAVDETRFYAEYWVENFKQPVTRISRLFFRTRDANDVLAPALYAFLLGVELGDPVDVETEHYGREGFNGTYFIEGIRYRATNLGRPGLPDIELELDVSPATAYAHNPWGTTEDGDVGET